MGLRDSVSDLFVAPALRSQSVISHDNQDRRKMNTGSGTFDIPALGRARAYLIGFAVTAVGVTTTFPLQHPFDRFPYLPLLVAAVIISAWIGGLGAGLVAACTGAVTAEYLVMGGLHAVGAYPQLLAQLTSFVA